VLNRRGGLNKWGGLADFLVYYMKNNGEGENFSVYYLENKGRVSKFLKLNKRVYQFIRHLRVCSSFCLSEPPSKTPVHEILNVEYSPNN
jgi:hypothetical protein